MVFKLRGYLLQEDGRLVDLLNKRGAAIAAPHYFFQTSKSDEVHRYG